MADKLATDIVRDALTLRASHPGKSALEVLDLAMEEWRDSDPVSDRSNEDIAVIDRTGLTTPERLASIEAEDLLSPSGASMAAGLDHTHSPSTVALNGVRNKCGGWNAA